MTAEEYKAYLAKKPKRNKFRNKITIVDGIRFHSGAEARRFGILKLLEKAGQIADLKRQVPFVVIDKPKRPVKYVADFVYFENGVKIIEDCKGCWTPLAKAKVDLMLEKYGVTVRITK